MPPQPSPAAKFGTVLSIYLGLEMPSLSQSDAAIAGTDAAGGVGLPGGRAGLSPRAVPQHRWDEHELVQVKTMPWAVLTFQQAGKKNSKKITCWNKNHGWETGMHGPGSSLAPAGGSPGLSSTRWRPPASCHRCHTMLRHFAHGCLSVFPNAVFNQPTMSTSASVCWVQNTDILGICNLGESFSPASSSAPA